MPQKEDLDSVWKAKPTKLSSKICDKCGLISLDEGFKEAKNYLQTGFDLSTRLMIPTYIIAISKCLALISGRQDPLSTSYYLGFNTLFNDSK